MGKSSFTHSGLYRVILFLIVAIGAVLGFRAVQFLGQVDGPATKIAGVPLSGGSTQPGSQSQAKHSIGARLDSFACDGTQWLLVISPLTDQGSAPATIHVAWSDGRQEDVPFAGFSDSTASYITQSNLTSSILSASAAIYADWSGEFSLRYGPCPPTATVQPTTTPSTTVAPPTHPAPAQSTLIPLRPPTQLARPTAPSVPTPPAGTQVATPLRATATATSTVAGRTFSAIMDGAECATYEWQFVIDGLKSAPRSIHVTWADGAQEDVPLSAFSEGIARYISVSNLDKKLVWASASLPLDWQGHFNLRHGPCIGGPYSSPPTIAPRTITPATMPSSGSTSQPSSAPTSGSASASPSAASPVPSEQTSTVTPGGPTSGSTSQVATATAIEPISTTTVRPVASPPTPFTISATPIASTSPSPQQPVTRAYLARTNSAECDAVEWEFVLDGLSDAPRAIDVTWTDGAEENVPLSSFAEGTAYYITTSNLATPLAWASVILPSDWAGHFDLHVGPCLPGAPQQATKPADTAYPTSTSQPSGSPHPAPTTAGLEGGTTPDAAGTPVPTSTSLPVSSPNPTKAAGVEPASPAPGGDTPEPATAPPGTPEGTPEVPVPIAAGASNPPSYTPVDSPARPSPSQPPPATGTATISSSPTGTPTITPAHAPDTPLPTRTLFSEVLPEVGTPTITSTPANEATPTEAVAQPTATPIPLLLPATGFLPGLLILGGAMLAAIGFVSIGLGLLRRRRMP